MNTIESNSKGSSFRILSWQRSDVYSDRLRWAFLLVIFAGVVLREKTIFIGNGNAYTKTKLKKVFFHFHITF